MSFPRIEVRDLTMAYGEFVVMRDLNMQIQTGEIFVIMGGSGSGKSTLLKHMIGLLEPQKGDILFDNKSIVQAETEARQQMLRQFGITFQAGALWTSMTLAENIALPLREYTDLTEKEILEVASLKLSLVGLRGFEGFYPHEISGGMRKRASLARAMALDPKVLCFDEPSAGLDPISSRRLDDLILRLRDSLGTTVVIVTHELESIFAIADNSIFLDVELKTQSASGKPTHLLQNPPNAHVHRFLTRSSESVPEKS